MSRFLIIRSFFLLILALPVSRVLAQPMQMDNSLRNYFRNPLDLPMQLSANFGELRPDHWHMGLDIRTGAKENVPVYAAADGYIAFVGVRPQGFGRFIIINHPNGLSTLYAHLNDFSPKLEEYVTAQQYEQESWAVELEFSKDQFPLTKGAFIAYSGNTGGSQGPHLHFEIIETKSTKRLNPLLFNFPAADNVPPTLVKLAIYDRDKTVYAQTPVLFDLKKTDSGYIIPKRPVIRTGWNKISFAIRAHDKMSSGGSNNGIYSAKLYFDEEPQVSFALDSIVYDERVYINAHIDYRSGGGQLQHLSQLPGSQSPVYKLSNGNGVISLTDTAVHLISIEVKDPNGNNSQLNFYILYDESLAVTPAPQSQSPKLAPGKTNLVEKEGFRMQLPAAALYDTIPLWYIRNNMSPGYAVTAIHQVNDASYPVHGEITISIKPDKPIPENWKDRLIMQRNSRGTTIRKVRLENEWMTARFGDFGSFQVFADVTPPQINELRSYGGGKGDTISLTGADRILFTPADNFGIVKKFRVELDGQWIRFTNDKSRNWIYQFDERCPYGVHELTATATDLAGNSTTKTWWFKRYPYTPPPKKKAVKKKIRNKK